MNDTPMSIEELKQKAAVIRSDIIEMICTAAAGHPGGSLSSADIVTALYFRMMRIDPQNPQWPDRDRFILSKGHACPVWYAALAERGYFDKIHLGTLRQLNSILQGHPDMHKTPGIDMTAGSLGHGFPAGAGIALSGKLQQKSFYVWVIIGDGESQEGSIWEAAMSCAHWKLDNLTVIMDCNNLQNDNYVDQTIPIEPIADKWRAFNWNVTEIDGHDMAAIVAALETAQKVKNQPTIILARTIKGKGVSYMENVCEWHGKAPSREQADVALSEIRRCSSEP